MKNYLFGIIFLVLGVVSLFSCSKDDETESDLSSNTSQTNLNSSGTNSAPIVGAISTTKNTKIVFGEQLTLNVTASDLNNDPLTYRWESTGGELITNNTSATWIVPAQVGTFTVKVTVSDGKDSTVVSKNFDVVGSYYSDFNKSSSSWFYSTATKRTVTNGVLTFCPIASTSLGSYSYKCDTSLTIPFSFKTKIAYDKDTTFTPASEPRLQFSIDFPSISNGGNYLKAIMLYIYPKSNTWAVRTAIFNVTTNLYEYQYIAQDAHSTRTIFSATNEYHTLGMTIGSDKRLTIMIDGAELYSSTALSTNIIYDRDLHPSSISYGVLPGLKMIVNDFYLTSDGSILK